MKKKVLIIIILIAFVCVSIPMFVIYMKTIQETRHNRQFSNILDNEAIEFVVNETDAKQKYGDNIDTSVSKTQLSFQTTSKQKFENYEHFVSELKEAKIYVTVNEKYCCVVIYTKDDQDNLIVSDWYWDK